MRTPMLLALLFAGFAAHADPDPAHNAVAVVDSQHGVLTVTSARLLQGLPVELRMNGRDEPLPIVERRGAELRARLPAGLAAGSYVVRIVHAPGGEGSEDMRFEIGAVGPYLDERR